VFVPSNSRDCSTMTDCEVYWLAGLLEGEGCFTTNKQSYGIYPVVRIYMTDRDVLFKARQISGVGTIHGPYMRKGHRIPISAWCVTGVPATALMKRVFPYMGERRRQRINELFELTGILLDIPVEEVWYDSNLNDTVLPKKWSRQYVAQYCRNGHEYTTDNVYIRGCDGARVCKQCHRNNNKLYRAKKKAARVLATEG
jgi:hypothetical protein